MYIFLIPKLSSSQEGVRPAHKINFWNLTLNNIVFSQSIYSTFPIHAQIFPSKKKYKIGRKMTSCLGVLDNAQEPASLLIMLFYHNKYQELAFRKTFKYERFIRCNFICCLGSFIAIIFDYIKLNVLRF